MRAIVLPPLDCCRCAHLRERYATPAQGRRITPAALPVAILLIFLIAAGCNRGSGGGDEDDNAAAPATTVTMAVSGAKVAVAPMRNEIRLLGSTVALRHITLRAPAAGRVLGLKIESGDRVHRGEVVAHIVSREVEAAENGLAIAQKLDPADAASMAASVKRYTHGSGIAVAAPEDAVVAQRIVSSGQVVAELDPLADFIDPRSVYVEADVPLDELAQIKPAMDTAVTSALSPGVAFPARVAAISPSLNPGGSTAPVRVEFLGPQRITQAGVPVELRVTTAFIPDAIVAPATAIFEDAANSAYYVFVAGRDGRAHRRPVTVGIRTPARVQVTSGLRAGELVITSGGYALSDGLKVQVAVAQD